MDSANTYQPRTSLTNACFDTIVYGNPLPDQLCKDLQCTRKALHDFLDSEECQNQLNLGQKLANFQTQVRAQRHAADALETLHQVTDNRRNPMAQRLAATELLTYANIHPEKPPAIILHQSSPNPAENPTEKPAVCDGGANVPPISAHGATPENPPRPQKIKNPKWKPENRLTQYLNSLLLFLLLLRSLLPQTPAPFGYTPPAMTTHPIAAESNAPALSIDGLVKRYGTLAAVRGISLDVQRGEVFGLLGRNGAGKTTTIECAVGLRRPDAGTIRVAGIDVLKSPAQARTKIGVQLQATALQDKITPRQALKLFAAFYPHPAPVSGLLERFDLANKADAPFDTLSGGQRQRLALALAVVHQPEVIFLDEPTAGLDAEARRELHAMILALRTAGRTVVLTTHDIGEAGRLCDRIAIIDRGEIITTARPSELSARTSAKTLLHVRTRQPLPRNAVAALANVTVAIADPPDAWKLETQIITGTLMGIAKLVEETGNELLDVQIHRPTLEDAFLELLRERDAQVAGAKAGTG